MTHHIELLQKLLSAITKAVSIILLIVTFFILQYLLDMDYVCSCDPDSHITGIAVFMALPPFILSCLVTLIESCYKKTIYYHGFWNFIQFSIFFVGKYMFLTCIWGGTVMLEGDWYICLKTNIDRNHTGIACEENLTNEENHTKAKYKNESMNIAFYVLTVLFTIWNIYELCKPFCMRIFNKNKFTGLPSYYRWMYEELLSEEVSNHLKEELKNIAEEKAKKLCEGYLKDIRKAELQRQPENHDSNNSNNSNSNDERNPKDSGSEAVSTDTLMSNSDSNADQNSSVTAAWHKISEPHFYLNDCAQVGQS